MALDEEVIAFVKPRVELEIAAQNEALDKEVEMIKADHSRRGLLRSGNLIYAVQEACANAVLDRASIVWTTLHRALTTLGIQYSEDLAQNLNLLVGDFFPEPMNGLKYRVQQVADLAGNGQIVLKMPDRINDARVRSLAQMQSEIQLFTMQSKRNPVPSSGYVPHFTFLHSTIGVVQSGHHSVAQVEQRFGALFDVDLNSLAAELATLRAELRKNAEDAEHDLAIANVASAEIAAKKGDVSSVLKFLKVSGKWVLDQASKIGADVAVKAIESAINSG